MRSRSKILLALLFLFCLGGFAGLVWFLRSEAFQQTMLRLLVARVQEATAASCSIRDLRVDLLRGRFDVAGFELRAQPAAPTPFSLSVAEVRGSLGWSSFLRLKPVLKQLTIVQPHLTLTTGHHEGPPWNPEGFLKVFHQSLELRAGRVEITDGWFQLDERRTPLNLALEELDCSIRYTDAPRGYRLHLAYKNSHLYWNDRDILYDLNLRATMTAAGFDFEAIEIHRKKALLKGDGWMRDWKSPVFLFHLSGSISEEELYIFESSLAEAAGSINIGVNVGWNRGAFHLTGKFMAPSTVYRKVPLAQTGGSFEILDDVFYLRDTSGSLGKGRIEAEGSLRLRSSDKIPHQMKLSVRGIALEDAARILRFPMMAFQNTADSDFHLTWHGGSSDLDVAGNGRLYPFTGETAAGMFHTSLQGTAEFRYNGGVWYLPAADLYSAETRIEAEGSDGSRFRVRIDTSRVPEVFAVVRPFIPSFGSLLESSPDIMDMIGSYRAELEILPRPDRQTLYEGGIQIRDAQWRGYRLDNLTADASWNGSILALTRLSASRGKQIVGGELALDFSDPDVSHPALDFRGTLQQVDLASLKDYGLDFDARVTGSLSGKGALSYSRGTWAGSGDLSIGGGSYEGEAFDSMGARVRAEGQNLTILESRITRGGTIVDVRGQVQLDTKALDLSTRLSGFRLRDVPAIQERNLDVEGRISAQGILRGTPSNPSFKGTLDLEGLRYASWELGGGKGTLELQGKVIHGTADVHSDYGRFKLQAEISTETGFPGRAVVALEDWNLQKLIASNTPVYLSDLSTALKGNIDISGRFAEPSSLRSTGELEGARLKFHDYELQNTGKIRFTILNQKLHVDEARVIGEGTSLDLSGDVPLDESSSLALVMSGRMNLKILERVETRIRTSGTAALNVRISGPIKAPQVSGQATLENTRLDYGDFPLRFSGMQGTISFTRNLVRTDSLQGTVGSGTFRLSGALEHDSVRLTGINLKLNAQKVRVAYPKDFRSMVDADLTLRGSSDAQVLTGEVTVIRADYAKEFSLMEQFASRAGGGSSALTAEPMLAGLRFNVAINSDEGLHINNELAKLTGSMRLTLRGTPAFPSLLGRVETTEGSIYFRGNRFEIMRGMADFFDRNGIVPSLDVRAEADVKSYRLLLDVKGELEHLNFNITSDPPLSTVDIVSLLTTGKSYESGFDDTRRQSEITGLSAATILSESLTGVVGKRVERLLGLQSFRVDPFLAGTTNDPTARVTISERISKDLSITYSRNLSTTEEQIVLVEYDVSRNLTVIATRDEDGKFALDFRFRKRFR